MVGTENIGEDFCGADPVPEVLWDHKIIYAPAGVPFAGTETVGPPGIDVTRIRMEVTKSVGKA